jgi:hypothetical protein
VSFQLFGKQDLKTAVTCIQRIWEEENLKKHAAEYVGNDEYMQA